MTVCPAYFEDSSSRFILGNVGVIDREIFRRTSGTLLLVDDDKAAFNWRKFAGTFRIFGSSLRFRNCSLCFSQNGGLHIIIEVSEKLTIPEAIALQLIFGDDPKRAALNMKRWLGMKGKKVDKFWLKRLNLLFSRKLL